MQIKSVRKEVATAGTREALSSTNLFVRKLIIQALSDNTNLVTVGDATVVGATATRIGIALDTDATVRQSDVIVLHDVDLMDVYVDAITNGDGVSYLYTR